MEDILFDSGIRSYRINGEGVLRFNPSDPNVYARFMEAAQKLQTLQAELTEGDPLHMLGQADKKLKALLGWVFGPENDFDKLLGGVNLLAVAGNGQMVVANLFEALQPILEAGAKECVAGKTQEALRKAQARREAQ